MADVIDLDRFRRERAKTPLLRRKRGQVLVDKTQCMEHVPPFNESAAKGLSPKQVRRRWPRFSGKCEACGYEGVAYASAEHYIAGDWK